MKSYNWWLGRKKRVRKKYTLLLGRYLSPKEKKLWYREWVKAKKIYLKDWDDGFRFGCNSDLRKMERTASEWNHRDERKEE